MKAYIIRIVGAAILKIFADVFSPGEWRTNTNIITGIILLTVILSPVAQLKGIDILSGYESTEEVIKNGDEIYADLLKEEFSKTVAKDVKERVRQEFSLDVAVEADVDVDDNGGIEKISRIIISGEEIPQKIAERISFIYDVREVILNES